MARLAALVLSSFLTTPLFAQAVMIEGSMDCGQWVEARTKDAASYYEHYLLGLINGLTLGRGAEFWMAGGQSKVSREAVYLWMDRYCREAPLSNVVTGAAILHAERSGWTPR